jgi:hypothetical protein
MFPASSFSLPILPSFDCSKIPQSVKLRKEIFELTLLSELSVQQDSIYSMFADLLAAFL